MLRGIIMTNSPSLLTAKAALAPPSWRGGGVCFADGGLSYQYIM